MYRVIEDIEDAVITLSCVVCMLVGVYTVYDSSILYNSPNELLKYKTEYEQQTTSTSAPSGMVAWLTVEGTGIDFPVMQGKDNLEYLNKNPDGEYSMTGSIFLDARNSSDFSDPYSMIYGHHMDAGKLFGALDSFKEETFWNGHRTGVLKTGGTERELRIFAVSEVHSLDGAVFAPGEHDRELTETIKGNHIFIREEDMPGEDECIIALSTCMFPSTQYRTVVFCSAKRNP